MRKITPVALCGTLVLVMLSVVVRMGVASIMIRGLQVDNFFTRAVFFDNDGEIFDAPRGKPDIESQIIDFDMQESYPFTKNITSMSVPKYPRDTRESLKPKIGDTLGKIKKYPRDFLEKRMVLYDMMVRLALVYEATLGWTLHRDAILVGDNYWIKPQRKAPVEQSITLISDFHQFLKKENIPLLYVGIPDKLHPDGDYYFTNHVNTDNDSMYLGLKVFGIPFLDLRANIHAENRDWFSLFYNTDHHWRTETGLWASKIIAERLNSEFSFRLDTSRLAPDNFHYETYCDWFLGALGKKVGHLLAKPDDFTLITPKFDTRFDILQFGSTYGTFATKRDDVTFVSAFIEFRHVEKKRFYNANPYAVYMNSDNNAFISNKRNNNGKKILIIGDSFANVIVPFLAILTQYVIDIDLRHFKGSLETLVEKEKPDIIVVIAELEFVAERRLFH